MKLALQQTTLCLVSCQQSLQTELLNRCYITGNVKGSMRKVYWIGLLDSTAIRSLGSADVRGRSVLRQDWKYENLPSCYSLDTLLTNYTVAETVDRAAQADFSYEVSRYYG